MCATSVRPATPDDAAAIAGVHVRSWQVAYRGVVPDVILDGLSVEQRRTTWRQLLVDDHGSLTLVADRGGEVAGFCSMWVFDANTSARGFYEGFGFAPDGAEMHDQPSGQTEIRLRAPLTHFV